MYLIANGGIEGYPKNTKEGVLLSKFDNHLDGVLINVRSTNDDKLVLYETDLIMKDNYISRMDYNDLKKIRIGNSINNYYIPLLEEILLYYAKDILIIKLHHNYDKNEELINELKKVLSKYYLKRIIILVDNDNLYDYLKLLTDYEVYNLNDSNNNFININVSSKNYNGKVISDIESSDLEKINNIIKSNDIYNDYFFITNSSKNLKKIINNW